METTIQKRALNMEEACDYLGGISRTTIYKLLGEGSIESFHIGTRRYFTRDTLDDFINKRVGVTEERT